MAQMEEGREEKREEKRCKGKVGQVRKIKNKR